MDELEHTRAALKRWRSKLKRAMTEIGKLEKRERRLERQLERPRGSADLRDLPATLPLAIRESAEDAGLIEPAHHDAFVPRGDLAATADIGDMPDFLKRGVAADKAAADQIRAEQEALKKAKGKGRIEKMKAKARGDLKKMPLTGKAALAAIHGDKNQT
jgi:hypothetical protein